MPFRASSPETSETLRRNIANLHRCDVCHIQQKCRNFRLLSSPSSLNSRQTGSGAAGCSGVFVGYSLAISHLKLLRPPWTRLLGPTAFALTLFFQPGSGFTQVPESKVHWFAGGDVRIETGLYVASGVNYGLTLRRRYLSAFNPAWNPSFVFPAQKPTFRFTGGLPVSIDIGTFVDLNAEAKSQVNAALAPYRAADTEIDYPNVVGKSYLSSPFDELALSFRYGRNAFGVLVERTLAVQVSAELFNAGTRVSTAVDAGGVPMDVVLNARIDARLKWRLDFYRVGVRWARPVNPRTVLGFAVVRQILDTQTSGFAHTDAAMLYAGQEYAFNDPNSLWPTDLSQHVNGRYHGGGWLFRAGIWRLLQPTTILDLSLQAGTPVIAGGSLEILQNRIPAFNVDALIWGEQGAELLDASKLKLTQLTLTERVNNPTYPELRLSVPAAFRFGLVQRSRATDAAFAATLFVSDYTLSYGPSSFSFVPSWRFEGLLTHKKFSARLALTRLNLTVRGSEHLGTLESVYFLPDVWFSYTTMVEPGVVFCHVLRLLPVPGYFVQIGVSL